MSFDLQTHKEKNCIAMHPQQSTAFSPDTSLLICSFLSWRSGILCVGEVDVRSFKFIVVEESPPIETMRNLVVSPGANVAGSERLLLRLLMFLSRIFAVTLSIRFLNFVSVSWSSFSSKNEFSHSDVSSSSSFLSDELCSVSLALRLMSSGDLSVRPEYKRYLKEANYSMLYLIINTNLTSKLHTISNVIQFELSVITKLLLDNLWGRIITEYFKYYFRIKEITFVKTNLKAKILYTTKPKKRIIC